LTAELQSSVRTIDAHTRAIAEDYARRAGMTLHQWLILVLAQNETDFEGERFDPALADELVWSSEAETPDAFARAEVDWQPPQDEFELDDDDEPFLADLLARLDAVRDEMAAKIQDSATRRLDRIERELIAMCGHIEAEQAADVADQPAAESAADDGGRQAARRLALEVARIVEAVEARFARIDVDGAAQMATLRGEIAQTIDGLAARINHFEQRDGLGAAANENKPSLGLSEADLGPSIDIQEAAEAISAGVDLALADDWAESDWLEEAEPVSATVDTEPAPITAADATEHIAGQAAALPSGEEERRVSAWPETQPRARLRRPLSGLRAAIALVGGGVAGFSVAAAACLIVASPSLRALAPQHMIAAAVPAKPAPMRAREAPPTFAVLDVSPKPSP
jgi:hypothetical protein